MPAPKKTSASSIVKKLPKQGNPKFVGPMSVNAVDSLEFSDRALNNYNQKMSSNQRRAVGQPEKRVPSGTVDRDGFAVRGAGQVPTARARVRKLGFNASTARQWKDPSANTNPISIKELTAAINKLPEASRKKLRNSLAYGLASGRTPF